MGEAGGPYVRWGTHFADFDNDGLPDLYAVRSLPKKNAGVVSAGPCPNCGASRAQVRYQMRLTRT